jgi:hypothetical protein
VDELPRYLPFPFILSCTFGLPLSHGYTVIFPITLLVHTCCLYFTHLFIFFLLFFLALHPVNLYLHFPYVATLNDYRGGGKLTIFSEFYQLLNSSLPPHFCLFSL